MGVIWGIPYLFIKIAVSELSPASLVLLRTAIGAGLLLPIAFVRKDLGPLLPHWRWIVAYTFVEVAAPWFFLSDAERRISSSLSGLLIALVPSIGAILAWATGADDRLDLRRVAGLGLGFLGVAALVGLDVGAGDLGAVGEVALVALGFAFLGEPLTIGIVLGFVLIVLGSVLATRRAAPAKSSVAFSRSPDLL